MRLGAIFVAVCMTVIAVSAGAVVYYAYGFTGADAIMRGDRRPDRARLYNTVSTRTNVKSVVGPQLTELSRGSADLARQLAEMGRRLAAVEVPASSAASPRARPRSSRWRWRSASSGPDRPAGRNGRHSRDAAQGDRARQHGAGRAGAVARERPSRSWSVSRGAGQPKPPSRTPVKAAGGRYHGRAAAAARRRPPMPDHPALVTCGRRCPAGRSNRRPSRRRYRPPSSPMPVAAAPATRPILAAPSRRAVAGLPSEPGARRPGHAGSPFATRSRPIASTCICSRS